MIKSFNLKMFAVVLVTAVGCTKLDERLNSTLTNTQTATALGSSGVGLLLQAAYNDLGGTFNTQDGVFSLEENSTDESLVPTRGGDWDDNGVWRVIHNHTWNANHSQVLNVYNALNKINFDATNVLGFSPSAQQAAEAKFLRAYSYFDLVRTYGDIPKIDEAIIRAHINLPNRDPKMLTTSMVVPEPTIKEEVKNSVRYILQRNILWGDALNLKTEKANSLFNLLNINLNQDLKFKESEE